MKNLLIVPALFILFAFTACTEEEPIVIDSSRPQGSFTVSRSGSFTAQNGTPTTGMASVGRDSLSTNYLKFDSSFNTELGTGTVTVYFSTADTLSFAPGSGNPDVKLVGVTAQGGEQYFKLTSAVDDKFTHVVLWCASANIPFGYAPLN